MGYLLARSMLLKLELRILRPLFSLMENIDSIDLDCEKNHLTTIYWIYIDYLNKTNNHLIPSYDNSGVF